MAINDDTDSLTKCVVNLSAVAGASNRHTVVALHKLAENILIYYLLNK